MDHRSDPWTLVWASLAGLLLTGLFGAWNAWHAFIWVVVLGAAAIVQRYSTWASTGTRWGIGLGVAGVWMFAAILLLVTEVWPGIVVGVGCAGVLWAMWDAPPSAASS